MKRIDIYTLLFLLASCSNEPKKEDHFTFPEIVDTTEAATFYFSPQIMQSATNDVGTLQKLSEDADLTTSSHKFNYYLESSDDLPERKSKSKRTYSGFSIFVDTTREVSMEKPSDYFPFIPPDIRYNSFKEDSAALRYAIEFELWKKHKMVVKALPIYIVNRTKKSIFISEQETELMLIQEAKDKKGKWKPIEYYRFSYCGNSYGDYVLRPNYYLMAKVFKYKGEFETLLRIKMVSDTTVIYSHPFRGSVNLSQFKPVRTRNEKHQFLDQ
jgi:hypothetical protein